MNLTFQERFVASAAKKVGCPYIWAGKGLWRLDLVNGGIVGMPVLGFDCSGLVECAIFEAGGPDHRGNENAQALFNRLQEPPPGYSGVRLAFFGDAHDKIFHVCICLEGDIHGWVIEACGGDHTTLTPKEGAAVFIHHGAAWGESKLQGYRALPSSP